MSSNITKSGPSQLVSSLIGFFMELQILVDVVTDPTDSGVSPTRWTVLARFIRAYPTAFPVACIAIAALALILFYLVTRILPNSKFGWCFFITVLMVFGFLVAAAGLGWVGSFILAL